MEQITIPDGYWEDARGCLIPVEQIKEIDKARDELVREKVAKVKAMQRELKALKLELMGDIAAFVELSAERYGAKLGGDKGNITLQSFDGRYRIKRQYNESIGFDEGLRAAKALIDECLEEWSRDSPSPLRVIVEAAFQINKEGRINTNAILGLRRHKIEDDRWQRAMQAIGDSLQSVCARVRARRPRQICGHPAGYGRSVGGANMTKEDLVRNVTERSRIHLGRSLCQADVEAVLQALKDVTAQELTAGGEVPLPGLGKLKTKDRAARMGRNPRTGEAVTIPARRVVVFAPSEKLDRDIRA